MIAVAVAAAALVGWFFIDRRYTRAADAQRAAFKVLRSRDRAAYWRLYARYKAVCTAGVTVELAAAQAADETAETRPIPYDIVDPHRPVWTEGALVDDHGAHADFGAISRAAFKEIR